MSDLSNPKEVVEWVRDWEAHALAKGGTAALAARFSSAHATMAAAVHACESQGRWPSPWRPEDVRESVRLLAVAVARYT